MRLVSIGAIVLPAVLLAACVTRPVLNVENASVSGIASKPLTQDQVRGAIVTSAAALGWTVKDMGPGKLGATFVYGHGGRNTAQIEIPYSATSYSLLYSSSTELRAADGQIHKIYNEWIRALTRTINAQLASL